MALVINMPTTFKVGDTADVRINGEPQRLEWTDADTLTILPNDRRRIQAMHRDGDLVEFIALQADEADIHITEIEV